MGAELVVQIVKGPCKLEPTPEQRAAAIAEAQARIATIRAYEAWEAEPFADEAAEPNLDPILDGSGYDSIDDVRFLTGNSAERWLDELVSTWNGGFCRDLSSRTDPDDESQRIVVAGELSWGEEPEGLGYTSLKAAAILGFYQAFGIH